MKIAIVLGSTRPGRKGEAVARRVLAKAKERPNAGALGGARAIEHLRAICSELQIAHVRQQLSFSLFTDFENFAEFSPSPMHDDAASVLFDQLEAWAGALKTLR
ncbi:hypothetical protein [Amycolatopsis sp. CA-128772]|uniref:hypothetical protein n=1 Tax=Amycolatopsis sp. CA-128772 TaxID=2073159 RepID=UPI000CD321F6|nr:hypothetical protein [Amycolatopsis sp. CA-128772]